MNSVQYAKRLLRTMGIYCVTLVALTLFVALTTPKGADHGWHLALLLIVTALWVLPVMAGILAWVSQELTGYAQFERITDTETTEEV